VEQKVCIVVSGIEIVLLGQLKVIFIDYVTLLG